MGLGSFINRIKNQLTKRRLEKEGYNTSYFVIGPNGRKTYPRKRPNAAANAKTRQNRATTNAKTRQNKAAANRAAANRAAANKYGINTLSFV
jgi:hypothetical protein